MLQACVDYVDHIFCFGVQTMKSVLDDCLAQFSSKYVLKEEQRQAAAKGCCGGSSYQFWGKFLNLPVVRGIETQTKRKECGISFIAITTLSNMMKLRQ